MTHNTNNLHDNQAEAPQKPSKHNGDCFCVDCNVFMGWENPRQLCGKYTCDNEDMWYTYGELPEDSSVYSHDVELKQLHIRKNNVWSPVEE